MEIVKYCQNKRDLQVWHWGTEIITEIFKIQLKFSNRETFTDIKIINLGSSQEEFLVGHLSTKQVGTPNPYYDSKGDQKFIYCHGSPSVNLSVSDFRLPIRIVTFKHCGYFDRKVTKSQIYRTFFVVSSRSRSRNINLDLSTAVHVCVDVVCKCSCTVCDD